MKKPSDKLSKDRYSFLFKLTSRFTVFLTGALFMTMFLYIAGNVQHFLDATQEMILLIASFASVALIIFSLAGFLECLVLGIAWRGRHYWLSIIGFALSEIFAIVIFVFSRAVIMLSGGLSL